MSTITVNGINLWVKDSGAASANKGTVLLLHGFPDTSNMWDPQITALNAAGYRTIAPDLLGLGNSVGPSDVKAYNLQTSLAPTYLALLDALDVKSAAIVGHDFGASLGWAMAFAAPDRVERLMVLSVGYGGTYFMVQPVEQRQASWYIPFFLLPGSEAVLQENGWQLWQMWLGQSVSQAQMLDYIERLSDSGALTTALNLYRGNVTAESFGSMTPVPPPFSLQMPVLGVHSNDDSFCLEAQLAASQIVVADGCWKMLRVASGGHWWFLQDPDTLNTQMLDFLGSAAQPEAAHAG